MPTRVVRASSPAHIVSAPESPNVRWFVCFLLFLATTINYMDRSVFSLIEPLLHNLPFMGWNFAADHYHQAVFDNNYGNIVICFQIAYGVGFLFAGRIIDKLGTKIGYALAIGIWALASMSHSLVTSVVGFCIARIFLGLGESGNFPAAIKATTEWFPTEERALAIGLFNSGSNASALHRSRCSSPLSPSRCGWRAAFISTGSMGLIWLVVWLLFPYNRLRRGSTQTQADLCHASRPTASRLVPLFAHLSSPRHLGLLHRQGPHRPRLVVLSLLSPQVPQPQLRPRPQPRLLVHRQRLRRLDRRLHLRRLRSPACA